MAVFHAMPGRSGPIIQLCFIDVSDVNLETNVRQVFGIRHHRRINDY